MVYDRNNQPSPFKAFWKRQGDLLQQSPFSVAGQTDNGEALEVMDCRPCVSRAGHTIERANRATSMPVGSATSKILERASRIDCTKSCVTAVLSP